jgi:hypothetical protein
MALNNVTHRIMRRNSILIYIPQQANQVLRRGERLVNTTYSTEYALAEDYVLQESSEVNVYG